MAHRLSAVARQLAAAAAAPAAGAAADDADVVDVDVAVVGAGFAGLYALHRLRGLGLRVRVLEKGGGVGGTWFWNRYPGAQCDIDSVQYCYSFSEELHRDWSWTQRYAPQREILRYLNHVADRFALRRDIDLNTRVVRCVWDDAAARWSVDVSAAGGARRVVRAAFVVMATGCLSERNWPAVPGLRAFRGRTLHTQDWPADGVDFAGRRVAVIGTGSSGVQAIPRIAETAAHVYVFQRTPNYVVPARQGELNPRIARWWKRNYQVLERRLRTEYTFPDDHPVWATSSPVARERQFDKAWRAGGFGFSGAFRDYFETPEANEAAGEFVRGEIRGIVRDPAVAEALCPPQLIACKRLCVGDGFYESFNRPNVTLVDLRRCGGAIGEVTAGAVRAGAAEYAVDDVVCATGFDAMTGALAAVEIRGRGGAALRDEWRDGPRTYLGLACAGFPNLFTVTGPQSPSVLTNVAMAIEQHVDWIAGCVRHVRGAGMRTVEATAHAQAEWGRHCGEVAAGTLGGAHPSCNNAWYSGANIPGKPRVQYPYRGRLFDYVKRCDEVAAAGYPGFAIT